MPVLAGGRVVVASTVPWLALFAGMLLVEAPVDGRQWAVTLISSAFELPLVAVPCALALAASPRPATRLGVLVGLTALAVVAGAAWASSGGGLVTIAVPAVALAVAAVLRLAALVQRPRSATR